MRLDRVSITTAPIMRMDAMIAWVLNTSFARLQPRMSATTGFTKAFVEAKVGLTFLNNQIYAEYARMDPNRIR